jgi:hypothetical protein
VRETLGLRPPPVGEQLRRVGTDGSLVSFVRVCDRVVEGRGQVATTAASFSSSSNFG